MKKSLVRRSFRHPEPNTRRKEKKSSLMAEERFERKSSEQSPSMISPPSPHPINLFSTSWTPLDHPDQESPCAYRIQRALCHQDWENELLQVDEDCDLANCNQKKTAECKPRTGRVRKSSISIVDSIRAYFKGSKDRRRSDKGSPTVDDFTKDFVIVTDDNYSMSKQKDNNKFQFENVFQSSDSRSSTTSSHRSNKGQAGSSKLPRRGAVRLSRGKKTIYDMFPTPMITRKRSGRFSIGERTTPAQRRHQPSLRRSCDVSMMSHCENVSLMKSLHREFEDSTGMFSNKRQHNDTATKKSREKLWRSLFPRTPTTQEKTKVHKSKRLNQDCSVPKKVDMSLLSLLKSKDDNFEDFRHFLKLEFSEENLDFWLDVDTYQKQRKFEKPARKIYNKYIMESAPHEINIESGVRDRIESNMQNPAGNTFNEAQLHIFNLIKRDPFQRFQKKNSS
ncbi:uncharacterized protein LOC143470205 [Clavelina lepadiformis]|uniref:uncharacterized protein LOC143470205 n=1 Tax=Clavelina lepadiformis TaxID=159417 RepID=UPI00404290FD